MEIKGLQSVPTSCCLSAVSDDKAVWLRGRFCGLTIWINWRVVKFVNLGGSCGFTVGGSGGRWGELLIVSLTRTMGNIQGYHLNII